MRLDILAIREALSTRTKRLACGHCPRRGHALEREGWHEMGVHGVGLQRRQGQLTHLLAHISRYELERRSHCGHHALRFLDAIQARLAASFLLGHGADRIDLVLDSTGNALAVATDAALQVDAVVGVADGTKALAHLLSLPGKALVLLASRLPFLLGLLQTWCCLWGPAGATPRRLRTVILGVLLHTGELLFSRRHGLVGSALFSAHRG